MGGGVGGSVSLLQTTSVDANMSFDLSINSSSSFILLSW